MDPTLARATLHFLHAAQNAMYAGGDAGPVSELLTDDVEWHVPGDNAIAGLLTRDQDAFDRAWAAQK